MKQLKMADVRAVSKYLPSKAQRSTFQSPKRTNKKRNDSWHEVLKHHLEPGEWRH